MGNVIKTRGIPKFLEKNLIRDMRVGDVGYAVEWAYDPKTQTLNSNYGVTPEKYGTASMRVECVGENRYTIDFEEPAYRKLF